MYKLNKMQRNKEKIADDEQKLAALQGASLSINNSRLYENF